MQSALLAIFTLPQDSILVIKGDKYNRDNINKEKQMATTCNVRKNRFRVRCKLLLRFSRLHGFSRCLLHISTLYYTLGIIFGTFES